MNGHLRETEFVDLLDGTLATSRRQHVEGCAECSARVAELSIALADAEAVDVPEPAPLFWDQFSARVRQAVAIAPPPRLGLWAWFAVPRFQLVAAATVALLLLAVGVWRSTAPELSGTRLAQQTGTSLPAGSEAGTAAPHDTFGDIETDEAWALVRTVADELPMEDIDAAGLAARPGSVEHMAASLSDSERSELARLLEDAIKRRRTSES